MVLTYYEIKEAVQDSYERLHIRGDYNEYNTFFASLNDYDQAEDFSLTEECCLYINFAILFIRNNANFDFIKERLTELIKEENLIIYKGELNEEYISFEKDLNELKSILYKQIHKPKILLSYNVENELKLQREEVKKVSVVYW